MNRFQTGHFSVLLTVKFAVLEVVEQNQATVKFCAILSKDRTQTRCTGLTLVQIRLLWLQADLHAQKNYQMCFRNFWKKKKKKKNCRVFIEKWEHSRRIRAPLTVSRNNLLILTLGVERAFIFLFVQNVKAKFTQDATRVNGTCCRQWECSHCTQATSKEKHSNLRGASCVN